MRIRQHGGVGRAVAGGVAQLRLAARQMATRAEVAGMGVLGDLGSGHGTAALVVLGLGAGLVAARRRMADRYARKAIAGFQALPLEQGSTLGRTHQDALHDVVLQGAKLCSQIFGFGDRHIAVSLMVAEAIYLLGDSAAAGRWLDNIVERGVMNDDRPEERVYLQAVAMAFERHARWGAWTSDVFESVDDYFRTRAEPSWRDEFARHAAWYPRGVTPWLRDRYAGLGLALGASIYDRIGSELAKQQPTSRVPPTLDGRPLGIASRSRQRQRGSAGGRVRAGSRAGGAVVVRDQDVGHWVTSEPQNIKDLKTELQSLEAQLERGVSGKNRRLRTHRREVLTARLAATRTALTKAEAQQRGHQC